METWKNACPGDMKRYRIIAAALENQPQLLQMLFRTDRPELAATPDVILKRTGAFSSGEKILIRAALDFWSGAGDLPLMELCRLDPSNFRNVVTAFIKMHSI